MLVPVPFESTLVVVSVAHGPSCCSGSMIDLLSALLPPVTSHCPAIDILDRVYKYLTCTAAFICDPY